MKISALVVENVLGMRSAQLTVPASGVALVVGPNASGKSSFAEAVRLALLGWSDRAGAKKTWPELVSDGARVGRVVVMTEAGPVKLSLPSGETSPTPQEHPAAELCLGKTRISLMKAADRVALVRLLAGDDDSKAIAEKLKGRGHQPGYLDRVVPLLRSGLEAAQSEAAGMAREAKGAWRSITGQNWGVKVAESWHPEGQPAHPGATNFGAQQEKAKLAAVSARNRANECERALARAQPMSREDLAALRQIAETYAGHESKRVEATGRAKVARENVQALEQEIALARASTSVLVCPCCDAKLQIDGRRLVKADSPTDAPVRDPDEIATELVGEQQRLATLDAEVRGWDVKVQAADKAARRLAAENEAAPEGLETLQADADAAAEKAKTAEDALAALETSMAWHGKAKHAADANAIVERWLALAEDLGPQGVAVSLAGGAFTRLNDELVQVCEELGFEPTLLNAEGQVFYAGRESWYCSESERWRLDTAVAIAVARLSGVGMVILDRLDVLDAGARPALLMGLVRLKLGCALVCCTAATRPGVPASIGLLWTGEPATEALAA